MPISAAEKIGEEQGEVVDFLRVSRYYEPEVTGAVGEDTS